MNSLPASTSTTRPAVVLPQPLQREHFDLMDQVGEGTYGRVFKAVHKSTGVLVALKIVNNLEDEDGLSFTAIREIKYLQMLSHNKNIIQLLGNCFWDDGSLVLVFEYMENDLSGLLSIFGVELSLSQIKCFMKQLLEGLHACHSSGIMHRDIKAANLLINSGTLKLADFGLATSYTTRPSFSTNVVTLWYRAPELLLGITKYKACVDIWSAGCIFIELLTRASPFPGNNEKHQMDLIWKHCGTPTEKNWPGVTKLEGYKTHVQGQPLWPNRLASILGGADKAAIELVQRMLTLNPEERITANEALDHDFFWTNPMPCAPSELPQFPALHEYEAKKRRDTDKRDNKRPRTAAYNKPHGFAGGHTRPQISLGDWKQNGENSNAQHPSNGGHPRGASHPPHHNHHQYPHHTQHPPPPPPPHHSSSHVHPPRGQPPNSRSRDPSHHNHVAASRDDVLPPQPNTRRVVDTGDMNGDRRGGYGAQSGRREGHGIGVSYIYGQNVPQHGRQPPPPPPPQHQHIHPPPPHNGHHHPPPQSSHHAAGWRSSSSTTTHASAAAHHSHHHSNPHHSSHHSSHHSNGHHHSNSNNNNNTNRDISPPGLALREDVYEGLGVERRPPSDHTTEGSAPDNTNQQQQQTTTTTTTSTQTSPPDSHSTAQHHSRAAASASAALNGKRKRPVADP
eukprot:TRINITY_DN2091_c0_g1_i2.p1 TRINITY_DN2091_c0_g1~~TRINITY_DN2091_c0_g1_i2.p1  ORF type:complete len:677 (-),score=126.44 TRINITY_DN2091_c0_g1_i2:227-2257(-)